MRNKALVQPLSGVRVLELGQLLAAPLGGQILADLGAEVIKVERPGRGDEYRHYGPQFLNRADGTRTGQSAGFLAANRGKRSVEIDITTPGGRDLTLELGARCDAVIENFRPGALARRGLAAADFTAVRPDIIYLSVSGFGQTGPYAERPGTDSVFQAMSGLMSVTGEPDGLPQKSGTVIADFVTGLYAAIAVMGALRHREINDGGGQAIDLALLDCALAAMAPRAVEYFLSGEAPRRFGHRTTGTAPAQLFRCSDGFINVQAGFDHHFRTLCELLDLPAIADDPRFATRELRVDNVEELEDRLQPGFERFTVAECYGRLEAAGLICAPIYDVKQAFDDPQVKHRGMRASVEHPEVGPVDVVASPLRLAGSSSVPPPCSPELGQHTRDILAGVIGLSDAEIVQLRAEGAIG